ncbi:MAG: transketolase [Holosporales bacterium]|jgi:transketolase|nr:transketolase [Holosporales bacterium]
MAKRLTNFANAVRCLSIDMVNEAKSGHQGAPLGFADIISVLFNKLINFSPNDEKRDRIILSAGHMSAMLYSAIYLTQKSNLSIDDLKKFRKFGSVCQGHPELNNDLGIEMTTGALGQGIATAVGIALALKKKQSNSSVFVIVGDGCLMEGVSHEAATFASSINLNNLIVLFDDNDICIDGHSSAYTTNNSKRFKAYGYDVFEADGHDYEDIYNTINLAIESSSPSFIAFKTIIGKYSKEAGNSKCHGKFMSVEETKEIRRSFEFSEESFSIPDGILWPKSKIQKRKNFEKIDEESFKCEIKTIKRSFIENPSIKPSRYFSGVVFSKLCEKFEFIIGGSADLSESNCTLSKDHKLIAKDVFDGNYICYGVREHAMGCIMNGLAIEGFIPYGGTFLVFSDYMKAAIRNAALMGVAPIFVLTHDSVAIGEDGGTHQPIEQLSSLRGIPNLNIFRPSCDVEVAECIEIAVRNRRTPSALVLSRQNLENLRKIHIEENLSERGMYEILPHNNDGNERLTIIATGSEVSLSFKIKTHLTGLDIRIISAPSLELFDKQPKEYKEKILLGKKLIIEAGSPDCWYKYRTQPDDLILGIEEFGESGSENELFERFGFTLENIKNLLKK